jgi:Family of unknown function (DUF6221)
MTLTEFLTARLDEDEAAAQAAYDRPSGYRVVGTRETEDHFARWKPLRVLAEVDAKRRIVQVAQVIHGVKDGAGISLQRESMQLLSALALPYADHPDYQQE